MTRAADINVTDEVQSLKLYLSLAFPDDEIRTERPPEDDDYTMLIEPPSAIISTTRGKYMSEMVMPLVVQRWCESRLEAAAYVERLVRLFRKGVAPGHPSRVPVWKWDMATVPLAAPDVDTDEPERFLSVSDVEAHVMPAEAQGKFVAVCDVRVAGWRIDYSFTDTLFQSQTSEFVPEP